MNQNPVYIDEAHVSDKGNSIVANSLLPYILSNIPEELIQHQSAIENTSRVDSSIFLEFEYIIETLFSNFEKKLMKTPFSTSESDNLIQDPIEFEKNYCENTVTIQ